MLSAFVRGICCGDQLLRSAVKQALALHRTAFLNTWAWCRVGQGLSHEQVLSPEIGCDVTKRSLWVSLGALRSEKSENRVSPVQSRKGDVSLSAAQKVKEAGRDFTYLIVVIIGIGVTGGLFYVIFKELFSSSSPSKIYGDALEKCRAHPEVIGIFGEPIKGYGEATRRGRRQLVSHIEFVKDGLKYMRLKFYIEGSEKGKQGTVHLEVKENPESGKYEYRYIFVDIDSYPRRMIIIEDNR
ncbi:mitochondrial import inner membrane translocase subunit Tim21 [Erythrolamprus reginae]|uniref:mitochondrial import inner membrane translocase subunit Tim21 n=1 Tax=Erythrolamprus reginae TaxID=121349 RepID=UPI00396C6FEC